jgi:hypothetical protein
MGVVSDVADVATIAATLFAGGGLFYTGKQWALSRKATAAQLLLQVDDLIHRHDQVFEDLKDRKLTGEEYSVRRAMGSLERLNVLVEADLVKLRWVEDLHGWRFKQLQANDQVQGRLRSYPEGWKQFIDLSRKLAVLRSQSDSAGKATQ